ncbi:DUF3293 domain-containing protein [Lacimicrobium alkaliphilum]|uniref:DUF3293 domain-containing protein n=1 Tax=Lacimicrobium alkaliphilum TaxID=1526571 RepID=UPI000BFED610|nr:DUF3293 domain-containing protein [Lacimicrobium alkaliphilum]
MTENTDSCACKQLWQHYSETVFLPHQPLPDWQKAGIITACNPKGKLLNTEHNKALNERLRSHLCQCNLPFAELTGTNPELSHQEHSLLINCTKSQAHSLAKAFAQNAFYWIENNQLYLCPCLLKDQPEKHLARFSERLIHR